MARHLRAAIHFSAILVCLNALAQEREELDEVIVTAQKVEQNLQDVPASVSVISGAAIEKRGANNISDLNGTSPNVIQQGMTFIKNTASLSIRGIGFFDTDPFADQKTQLLVDGIPHARVTGLGHDQIDVKRIEVIRGPQGTLFGRNSLAGTINIITREASADAGLTARGTLGKYGLAKYVVSGESGELLNDSIRSRLTIASRNYDGHVTNDFNGNRLGQQASQSIRWKVNHNTPRVNSNLTYYRSNEETKGIPATNFIQDPYGTADGDVHLVNMDTDGFNDSTERGFTLVSDIDLDIGKIAIAANTHASDFLLYTDLDGRAGSVPPAPGMNPRLNVNIGFDIEQSQDSLEIRFHDDHTDRMDYVVGVFTFREKARRFFYQNIGRPFSATMNFEDAVRTTIARQDTNSIALFAQSDIYLSDRLALIVGGRVTRDEKRATVGNYGLPPPAPQRPPIILDPETTWNQTTWKLGGKFDHSDAVLSYFTISTGYKAGGFTSRATVSENVGPYDAEYVTNYEAGVKANLLQNRLRLSAAGFFADYEDLVGFVRRTNSTGRGNEPINANLGNVAIKGLEFESSWLLTGSLGVDFAVGLLDAQWDTYFIDLNNDGIATDNSHLDVLMAPELTVFTALHHTWEGKRGSLESRISLAHQSRYNTFGESNDEIFYRPGTTLLNGSVTWTWGSQNHTISLFGRNLGDKSVPKTIIGASIFPIAVFEPPRVIGVELQLSY